MLFRFCKKTNRMHEKPFVVPARRSYSSEGVSVLRTPCVSKMYRTMNTIKKLFMLSSSFDTRRKTAHSGRTGSLNLRDIKDA
jgi:hypothetical protein